MTLTLNGDGTISEKGLSNVTLHKKGSAGAKKDAEKHRNFDKDFWKDDD